MTMVITIRYFSMCKYIRCPKNKYKSRRKMHDNYLTAGGQLITSSNAHTVAFLPTGCIKLFQSSIAADP